MEAMSPKSTRSPAQAAASRRDDDLEGHIRRAERRKRIFSWIVLSILLLAFVAMTAMQAAPFFARHPSPPRGDTSSRPMDGDIQNLEALVRQHPNDEGMNLALANLEYDAENYAAAAKRYRKVLALDSANPDVRVNLGTCLYYERQPAAAIAAFKEALAGHPRFVKAYVNLGIVYSSLGRQDKALDAWRRALRLTGDPVLKGKIQDLLDSLSAPGR